MKKTWPELMKNWAYRSGVPGTGLRSGRHARKGLFMLFPGLGGGVPVRRNPPSNSLRSGGPAMRLVVSLALKGKENRYLLGKARSSSRQDTAQGSTGLKLNRI